jgi:hypothetical protein
MDRSDATTVDLYRRLLAEIETMKRRLEEISAQLQEKIEDSSEVPASCSRDGQTSREIFPEQLLPANPRQPAIDESASLLVDLDKRAAAVQMGLSKTISSSAKVTDVLDLAQELRDIYVLIVRSGGITLQEILRQTGEDESAVKVYVKTLVLQGYVSKEISVQGDGLYKPCLGSRRRKSSGGGDILERLKA